MPIHSSVLTARLAEAGKVKIGRLGEARAKQSGEGTYRQPERLNYFIVTKTVRKGNDDNFIEDTALMAELPTDKDEKIRQIPILLDSDLIEEVFPTSLACYAGRALHCRGTGFGTATRWEIKGGRQTGLTRPVACTCPYLTDPNSKLVCKPHGTLWFTIVAGEETRLGVRHSFRTTSWNSIRAIQSALETIQKTVGTIVGIPLIMVVRPTLTRTRDGGTRTIQVVHVELRTKDLLALQRHAIEAAKGRHTVAAIAGRPLHLALPQPAGPQETATEQAEIQQEWHPEEEPEDEGEEGDLEPGKDFDAKTGEIFDVPFTEKEGTTTTATAPASTTVPASQLGRGSAGYTTQKSSNPVKDEAAELSFGAKSTETVDDEDLKRRAREAVSTLCSDTITSSVGFNEVLPKDDPARGIIGKLLKELAELRGFEGRELQKGMKEITAEVTTLICGEPVPFANIQLGHAMKIVPELQGLITLKRHEMGMDDAEDDGDIPTGDD